VARHEHILECGDLGLPIDIGMHTLLILMQMHTFCFANSAVMCFEEGMALVGLML